MYTVYKHRTFYFSRNKKYSEAAANVETSDSSMDGGVEPLLASHQSEEEKGILDGEEKRGTTRYEKQSNFVKDFGVESNKLWKIAGPAIFTSICQYSLGALTQTFTGFVGELELAAVSVENSVVAGLAFGVMVWFFSLFNSFGFYLGIWIILKLNGNLLS